jgi:hypothetical protein
LLLRSPITGRTSPALPGIAAANCRGSTLARQPARARSFAAHRAP